MQAMVVDVREPSEFATGHIQGEVLVPLRTLQGGCSSWNPDQPITPVCVTGRRTEGTMRVLNCKDLSRVSVFAGGMEAWRADGKPVVAPGGAK